MTTYITLSLIIMLVREIYANKGIRNISNKSWVWVCLAPITLPLTIGYAFYSAKKELQQR